MYSDPIQDRLHSMIQNAINYGKTRYAKYLAIAEKSYYESTGRKMSDFKKAQLIRGYLNMENDLSYYLGESKVRSVINEATTTPDSINKFIHYAFGFATAFIPNPVLDRFTSVQTMDKKIGEIFYMDIVKGDTKGTDVEGDVYMSAMRGPLTGKNYTTNLIDVEEVGQGDGVTNVFNRTLIWKNVLPGTVSIRVIIGGSEIVIKDNGNGGFIPDPTGYLNAASSSINYKTGAITLGFTTAPDNDTKLLATYNYNSLIQEAKIPTLTARVTTKIISATRRVVNLKYLFDSALILSKHHGIDLDAELLEKGTAGMINEIAIECADKIYERAVGGADEVIFSKNPPSPMIPYIQHRLEIIGKIADASTKIEQKIRYAKANFILGGREFVSLVRGLPRDVFNAAQYDVNPVGMHVVGVLDGQWEVIQNLDYKENVFTIGANGTDGLHVGSVFAEFIPITVLNANWMNDADIFRTVIQWSAFDVINENFYVKGRITA